MLPSSKTAIISGVLGGGGKGSGNCEVGNFSNNKNKWRGGLMPFKKCKAERRLPETSSKQNNVISC